MATNIYQDQPNTSADGTGVGLVAGLVLVLAVIALVFLATRAAPNVGNGGETTIPNQNGGSAQIEGSITPAPQQ